MRIRVHTVVRLVVAFLGMSAIAAEFPGPERWEKDIRAFEEKDKAAPPPRHAVLFVGSSSIRLWDLPRSFPKLATINRGFGGSFVSDSVCFAPRIVLPYEPAVIVFYAGDNDIAAGKSPERVRDDYLEFVRIVNERLPATRIVYLPIKPSLQRRHLIEPMRKTNRLIEAAMANDSRHVFVGIEPVMLGADGMPRPELFVADGLHLSAEGYALWTRLVAPHLARPNLDCRFRVYAEDGAPIANAEVTVGLWPNDSDTTLPLETVKSDANGNVAIEPLDQDSRRPPARWEDRDSDPVVIVRAQGFVTAYLVPKKFSTPGRSRPDCFDEPGELIAMLPRAQSPAGGAAAATLIMRRGTAFSGRMVDASGAPLENAAVVVESASRIPWRTYATWHEELTTNARGEYAFRAPCAEALARVPGFEPCKLDPARGDSMLELKRRPEAMLAGIVKDWEGGIVAGARVRVAWESQTLAATSDAQGRFEAEYLPADRRVTAEIEVAAVGYERYWRRHALDLTQVLEVKLDAKPTLRVKFVDYATGLPIAHTAVLGLWPDGLRTDGEGVVLFREPEFHYATWDSPYPHYSLHPWACSERELFPAPATKGVVDLGVLRVKSWPRVDSPAPDVEPSTIEEEPPASLFEELGIPPYPDETFKGVLEADVQDEKEPEQEAPEIPSERDKASPVSTVAIRVVPPEPWLADFVRIELRVDGSAPDAEPVRTGATDYRLEFPLESTGLAVRVRCMGCLDRRFDLTDASQLPKEVRLERSDECILCGTVYGPGGKRIVSEYETARIWGEILSCGDQEWREPLTSSGMYNTVFLSFDREGRCLFAVDPVGWARICMGSDYGTSEPVVIELEPGKRFDDLVWRIRPDGGPGSATVTAFGPAGKPLQWAKAEVHVGRQHFVNITDSAGNAYFASLPGGPGVVTVSYPASFAEPPSIFEGETAARGAGVSILLEDEVAQPQFLCEAPVLIAGHTPVIVDCAPLGPEGLVTFRTDPVLPEVIASYIDEKPASGNVVVLTPEERRVTLTAEKPEFSFPCSSAYQIEITAWSPDKAWWGRAVMSADAGETRSFVVPLARTVAVKGTFEVDGVPFAAPKDKKAVAVFDGPQCFPSTLEGRAFTATVVPGAYCVRVVEDRNLWSYSGCCIDKPGYAARPALAALPGFTLARNLVIVPGNEVAIAAKLVTGGLTAKIRKNGAPMARGIGRVFSREDNMLLAEIGFENGALVVEHELLPKGRFPIGSYTLHVLDRTGAFLGSANTEVTSGAVREVTLDLDRLVPVTVTIALPDGTPASWLTGRLSTNGEALFSVFDRDTLTFLAPEGKLEGWVAAEGYELQHFGLVTVERGKENRVAARLVAGGRLFVPYTAWPRELPKVAPCDGPAFPEQVRFDDIYTADLKDLLTPETLTQLLAAGRGRALATRILPAGKYRVTYAIDAARGERTIEIVPGKGTVLFP